MNRIRLLQNALKRPACQRQFSSSAFCVSQALFEQVAAFHRSFEEYRVTPLRSLTRLAQQLGVSRIDIKDESYRFGLKAFKALGSSWALAKQVNPQPVTFDELKQRGEIRWQGVTTATDGNHGKGVAWMAHKLAIPCVVFMPVGSKTCRVEAIAQYADKVVVTDVGYDQTVQQATQFSRDSGYLLMQDTSWPGYEAIPMDIMHGYLTILSELEEHLSRHWPTHVFLQAGVGTFAAAVVSWFLSQSEKRPPKFIIMEPKTAACYFDSLQRADGKPHLFEGQLNTQMAGLACGMPSLQAWQILSEATDMALECDDVLSSRGMWRAAKPLTGDPAFVSGESAAVGLGLVDYLCWPDTSEQRQSVIELKNRLALDENSKLLFFSTEGDTDPENYRRVTGLEPSDIDPQVASHSDRTLEAARGAC